MYNPPFADALEFQFAGGAYTPPNGGEVAFNFVPTYTAVLGRSAINVPFSVDAQCIGENRGVARAVIELVAAATGDIVPAGTSNVVFGFNATATGGATVYSTADIAVTLVATATGVNPILGQGVTPVPFEPAAAGRADVWVASNTPVPIVVTAAGIGEVRGVGDPVIQLSPIAVGGVPPVGWASVEMPFTSDACVGTTVYGVGKVWVITSTWATSAGYVTPLTNVTVEAPFTVAAKGTARVQSVGAVEVPYVFTGRSTAPVYAAAAFEVGGAPHAVGFMAVFGGAAGECKLTVAADGVHGRVGRYVQPIPFTVAVEGGDPNITGECEVTFFNIVAEGVLETRGAVSVVTPFEWETTAGTVAICDGRGAVGFEFAAEGHIDLFGAAQVGLPISLAAADAGAAVGKAQASVRMTASASGVCGCAAVGTPAVRFGVSAVAAHGRVASGAFSYRFSAASVGRVGVRAGGVVETPLVCKAAGRGVVLPPAVTAVGSARLTLTAAASGTAAQRTSGDGAFTIPLSVLGQGYRTIAQPHAGIYVVEKHIRIEVVN